MWSWHPPSFPPGHPGPPEAITRSERRWTFDTDQLVPLFLAPLGNQRNPHFHLCFKTFTFRKKTLPCFFRLQAVADPKVMARNLPRGCMKMESRLVGGRDEERGPMAVKGTRPPEHRHLFILIKKKSWLEGGSSLPSLGPSFTMLEAGKGVTPLLQLVTQTFRCAAGPREQEKAGSSL